MTTMDIIVQLLTKQLLGSPDLSFNTYTTDLIIFAISIAFLFINIAVHIPLCSLLSQFIFKREKYTSYIIYNDAYDIIKFSDFYLHNRICY